MVYSHFKFRDLGALTWQYGDQDDNLTREAFRSVLIVGPDESIYALPNDVSVDALNSGFVSPLNKKFPVKELVRH